MIKRKFYKKVYTIEVLSDGPIEFTSLHKLDDAIQCGECSGRRRESRIKILNGKQLVKELAEHGTSPSFFKLAEDGSDLPEKK